MSRRAQPPAKPTPGIEVRHFASCASRSGDPCDCSPTYRALIRLPGRGKLQRSFKSLAAAKAWRQDALAEQRRGVLAGTTSVRVRDAAEQWLIGARAGAVRNRSGHPYKPAAIRGYEQVLRDYVLPELGGAKLSELRRADAQRFVDRLIERGLSASTVRNALMPLRAICRRALVRGEIHVNPTSGLELPAQRGKRDRFASPTEARALIAAVPERDRPIWATAVYAGLRRGELRALRFRDVDLRRGLISVERTWDRVEGALDPKSAAGVRRIPIPEELEPELAVITGAADDLVFGRSTELPFDPSTVSDRAQRAWRAAGLRPITLHECRHTYASLMIAAGVNPKALQTFMGHASITITLDRYGHLMPGSEEEAVALLNGYLRRDRELVAI